MSDLDTVAWVNISGITTLAIYRSGSWWTDVDADETGVSGHRHDPEAVEVLRCITVSSNPDRLP